MFRKTVSLLLAAAMFLCMAGCTPNEEVKAENLSKTHPAAHTLKLYTDRAKLDGEAVQIFDYTWHCDPGVSHDEVKDAPAEYHTGTQPQTDAAVFIDKDLYYFPELPADGFSRINYDGETEWAYYYTDGEHNEYIFATLPDLGNSLPVQMMHSAQEAAENQVLHITQPGEYILEGTWKGQIRVELGDRDSAFTDENAKVTIILNGADISCSAAPGIVFYSAYECDNGWETRESSTCDADTGDAGVTVIVADGTENTVTGTNVSRMLKTKYKDESSADTVKVQKKLRKTDGAFYSYVSMNMEGGSAGTGSLTVNSGFEGIDSELHLSFNGGNITVNSQDDGINVNEDHVSVVSFNGGNVTIHAAQGAEGDGVDSNGYIVLNGGMISVDGIRVPDSALDSEDGITYHGGTVILDGKTQNYEPGSTFRETGGMGGGFGGGEEPGRPDDPGSMIPWQQLTQSFDMKTFKQKTAELDDDGTLEDVLAILGIEMPDGGQPFGRFGGGQRPDGEPPQKP